MTIFQDFDMPLAQPQFDQLGNRATIRDHVAKGEVVEAKRGMAGAGDAEKQFYYLLELIKALSPRS